MFDIVRLLQLLIVFRVHSKLVADLQNGFVVEIHPFLYGGGLKCFEKKKIKRWGLNSCLKGAEARREVGQLRFNVFQIPHLKLEKKKFSYTVQ